MTEHEYERFGTSGMGRCLKCSWTNWWSNLMHQGCANPECPNNNGDYHD